MSTSDGHDVIKNINVLYNSCTSDHIPMCLEVSLELVPHVKKISWTNLVTTVLMVMLRQQKNNLENVNLPHDAIICNSVNCTDDAHISAINVLYHDLIEIMSNASDELVIRQDHTNVDLAGMTIPEISTLLL